MNILDYIGFFGPIILFISTIILLIKKSTLLYIYIIGMFLNSILNYVLKGAIREPRPSEDIHIFNMELNSSNMTGKRQGFDRFGMPSGHSQSVFFSLMFIYLTFKNANITIFYLVISLLTIYQRVKFKNHTISQVVAGLFVGSLFGAALYNYGKNLNKGIIREKSDDNALS